MRREREKRREAMRSDWEKVPENVRGKGERQCLEGREEMRRERERSNEKGEVERQ